MSKTEKLNETDISYPGEYIEYACELVRDASRCIRIYSPELKSDVYGRQELVQVISSMIRSSRHCHAKILVGRHAELGGQQHSLVDLARQLPTLCQLKLVQEPPHKFKEDFILIDRNGLIVRKSQQENRAQLIPNAPARTVERIEHFDYLWARGLNSPELRHLAI